MAFPQGPQGVGVVEGDPALLEVEAHAEPGGQRVGEARGRGGAVVSSRAVAVVVAVAVLGQVDLTHAHGEEAERGRRVQVVLRTAVVAAVWVVPGRERAPIDKRKRQRPPNETLVLLFRFYLLGPGKKKTVFRFVSFAASHRGLAMSWGR